MQYSSTNKYRVGITSDVLMSNGQPIFGDKALEILNRPDIEWEYMKPSSVIGPDEVNQYDAICAMLTDLSQTV